VQEQDCIGIAAGNAHKSIKHAKETCLVEWLVTSIVLQPVCLHVGVGRLELQLLISHSNIEHTDNSLRCIYVAPGAVLLEGGCSQTDDTSCMFLLRLVYPVEETIQHHSRLRRCMQCNI